MNDERTRSAYYTKRVGMMILGFVIMWHGGEFATINATLWFVGSFIVPLHTK